MSGKVIAKNSIFLLISSVFQKIVGFIYFIFLTYNLIPDSVGKYSFAFSFSLIFCVFMDFGTNALLIRETSRDESKMNKYTNNIFILEIILCTLFVIISFVFVNILGYSEITKQLVYIAIFSVAIDNLSSTFYAVLRGRQQIWFESFGYAFYQVVVLTLGFILVKNGAPLVFLAIPPLIASCINFIYSFVIVYKKTDFRLKFDFDFDFIKKLLIAALPFALTGIFTKLYSSLDSLFLSIMSTDENIAYYQAAFKLVFALQFIPIAIGSAIYPAFSKNFKEDKDQLRNIFEKSFIILSIIAVPLSFGMFAISSDVINFVYPSYQSSIPVLMVFSASFFFMFLNTPLGLSLSACDKQKMNTRNSFVSMLTNLFWNWLLIPIFGIIGAAIASVFSFMVLFLLNFIESKKVICFKVSYILKNLFKIVLASFMMYLVVVFFKQYMNFIFVIPIGMIFYATLVFVFKIVNLKDIKRFIKR